VPSVYSLADGINLLSGTRIVTGTVKITIEGIADPVQLRASVDGTEVRDTDAFCTDPVSLRHEFNFKLPTGISNGPHQVEISIGRRLLAPIQIEVAN
jgi:hypothetical protein